VTELSFAPVAAPSDRPLRILIGADTFPPDVNGAAQFARRLAVGLSRLGHEVHVVCPASATDLGATMDDGIIVHRLPAHKTPVHPTFRVCLPWRARRAVSALLDGLRPDVVHAQAHFIVGRALINEAAGRHIPVVATNHFMPENLFSYTKIPNRLRAYAAKKAYADLSRVFARADRITAPTPRAAELLREGGLPMEVTPVSCGIDIDKYREVVAQAVRPTVLFVGRLDEEKNVDQLIRAHALLPAQLETQLEIVGDGSQRDRLEALVDELGTRDRVRFHGYAPDGELLKAYARATVFCMPGTAELQSLVTMEAMSAGKPVVAADAMALPHLVRHGHNGFLFAPGDVPALAARLADVLEAPAAARARMGAESGRIIAAHAIGTTLAAFEEIYRDVIGTGARRVVADRSIGVARAA
jgi:glycosyltransferase involved in cell wall biosynthesis